MRHCLCLFFCTVWREKERSRIRVVQIDNLTGFLAFGDEESGRVPNSLIREMCGAR